MHREVPFIKNTTCTLKCSFWSATKNRDSLQPLYNRIQCLSDTRSTDQIFDLFLWIGAVTLMRILLAKQSTWLDIVIIMSSVCL